MTDRNPKALAASTRVPMHYMPDTALAEMALAFYEGICKGYGPFNWRTGDGVAVSTYMSAMDRHRAKYKNGQTRDPKTRVHELASIMACCAILIDAERCGKLQDDRPPPAPMGPMFDELESVVKHLQTAFPPKLTPVEVEPGVLAPPSRADLIPIRSEDGFRIGSRIDFPVQPPHVERAFQEWEANAAEKRAEPVRQEQKRDDATERVIEQRHVEAMQRRLIDTELAADRPLEVNDDWSGPDYNPHA